MQKKLTQFCEQVAGNEKRFEEYSERFTNYYTPIREDLAYWAGMKQGHNTCMGELDKEGSIKNKIIKLYSHLCSSYIAIHQEFNMLEKGPCQLRLENFQGYQNYWIHLGTIGEIGLHKFLDEKSAVS